MNILDENIIASQRQRLQSWRIPVRQIGVDIARKGLQDEERRGERDPERLSRLAVEDQLELHGLFHGQVGRRGAFEKAIHVVGDAAQRVARARSVRHEPPTFRKCSRSRHRGQPTLQGQVCQAAYMG